MSSGGRSSWFDDKDPVALRERLRRSESGVRDAQFESLVARLLADCLADYNSRDTEIIGSILDRIKADLGKEFELAVDLRFGGSVSKNTFVNGLSDIDALVLLHPTDAAGKSPEQLREIFAEKLQARFGADAVREGHLAVTLNAYGQEIQLLPAMAEGGRLKISSHDGKHWSTIRPRAFSVELTKLNKELDSKLVPTIKLAKGILAGLPEQRQISGYHAEVLAVAIFRGYMGDKTPKDMLRHLFDRLPDAVRQPIGDPTGQSMYVDEYLGPAKSVQREIVADAVDRIARRIRNADGAKSVDRWRELVFGG
jgi:hypothetical protein